jgi:predicted esterase YcpF (UPF0227 family)
MAERGLSEKYACPELPALASDAIESVESLIGDRPGTAVCFVGSSLGGFYATHLAEKHAARAVLINPAIDPHIGLRAYLGVQKNLHTGAPYELTETHLRDWAKLYAERVTPQRYLLLVETGDEVLDYRKAVARYAGAQQHVIAGGDHSLQSFPEHLPRILRFAGLPVEREA